MPKLFIPLTVELPSAETIDVEALLDGLICGRTDLVCVLGPTASGKTRYAVGLCRQLDALCAARGLCAKHCEILSADSRQVYRGMDIGTGKDLDEYGEVPYHLIDILPAGTKYNVYEYQRDFEAAYKDIVSRGCIPVLCGGTGLYIEAVTCGYALTDVPPDPDLRAELEAKSDKELQSMVTSLSVQEHPDSRQRTIRAIEKALYRRDHPVKETSFLPKKTYYIGTLVTREVRNARIDERLRKRLDEGMIDEIKGLIDAGVDPQDLIYYGLEYKYVTQYVLGDISYDQMFLDLSTAIHQFAKRQMTWFRGMERKGAVIHWTEV